MDLMSLNSRVEAPFISVKLAGLRFGVYKRSKSRVGNSPIQTAHSIYVDYPNFIKSMYVKKNASGTVNEYTINFVYAVTQEDDPNFLEKVFSAAKKDRKIVISYGDYNTPNFIFREEEAIITSIKPQFNLSSSTINYTMTAVSTVILQSRATYTFPAVTDKPSNRIIALLKSTEYKLTDLFYGMRDIDRVLTYGLIPTNDKVVRIEAQSGLTVLQYLNYLVSCMVAQGDSDSIRSSIFALALYDDITSQFNGPYFKVYEANSREQIKANIVDELTIDVGYPAQTSVVNFQADVDDTWSILYDYNESLQQSQTIYRIDNDGKVQYELSNRLMTASSLHKATEHQKQWFSKMTSFPINATLTLRGLLKPIELVSKIKINILFYGQKHILSGIYIVTGQQDTVSESGYQSALSLTRIGGIEW